MAAQGQALFTGNYQVKIMRKYETIMYRIVENELRLRCAIPVSVKSWHKLNAKRDMTELLQSLCKHSKK